MPKPLTIGSLEFRTQSAALSHFQSMLRRHEDGQMVSDPQDHRDLTQLIERFDAALDAVGEPLKGDGQIERFERRINRGPSWSSSSFWVVRKDGTATDFSYRSAVTLVVGDRSRDFYGACRASVSRDLAAVKRRAFEQYANEDGLVECELTGELISLDDAHLDHAWPYFSQLVAGFRVARGWSREIPQGVVSLPQDAQFEASFLDGEVEQAFLAYHHNLAILRIVSKTANLSNAHLAKKPNVKRPILLEQS